MWMSEGKSVHKAYESDAGNAGRCSSYSDIENRSKANRHCENDEEERSKTSKNACHGFHFRPYQCIGWGQIMP